jgi:hypothetical protein
MLDYTECYFVRGHRSRREPYFRGLVIVSRNVRKTDPMSGGRLK